jgi:hypothetical protein
LSSSHTVWNFQQVLLFLDYIGFHTSQADFDNLHDILNTAAEWAFAGSILAAIFFQLLLLRSFRRDVCSNLRRATFKQSSKEAPTSISTGALFIM